jgi:acyl carrier protein
MVLGGNGGTVAAAFNASGTRVVTADADGTARIWDTTSGQRVVVLRGSGGGLTSVAFDPTGKRVVAGRQDGTAWVWDVATGEAIAVLYGHENVLVSAQFDAAGRRIVTASADGTARVWDVTEPIAPVLRAGAVSSAAFDHGGKRLVTGKVGGAVRVWNVQSWRRVTGPQPTERLVRAADGTVELWDAATAKRLRVAPTDALAVSRAGSLVAIQGDNSTVRIRDTADGKTVAVLRGHSAATSSPYAVGILSAAFDPDGTHLVTVGLDSTARIWVAATGRQLAVLRGHGNIIESAVFDPTGTRVVTTGQEGNARIWNAATGETEAVLPGASAPAVFDARGEVLVTLGPHGTARVWDAATGERLAVLRDSEPIRSTAISPDGRFVVTVGTAGTVRVHVCRACGPVDELLGAAATYPRPEVPASLRGAASAPTEVRGRVRGVIAEQLGVDPNTLAEDVPLETLDVDSLDQIELVMELEDTFGISLSDETCALLTGWTVAQIADYVAAHA